MDAVNWGTPPVGLFNFPIELWQKTGRFAERGLELSLSSHLTGEEYGARIRAGVYDMGQIGTPVFLPAAVGSREYAVVSVGFCDFAPFYLVAAPGVERLADCRAEKVVINKRMTCPGSLLEWHARQEGLTIDDFDVVELMRDSAFDNYGQAFADGVQRGAFRIGILYEPYVSLVERQYGWRVLADYADLLRPANYGILLYARRRWIDQKPELVRRMVQAYFAAAAYGVEHPAALRPFAAQLPFVSEDDIERAMHRDGPHWLREPSLDSAFLRRVEQELKVQQRVPADYSIRDYVAAS
ncbi:MAG: ABC transporter substrate-binding protein [Immundisolibacter sp.]|uniref:ABC transporter substrate-binding protein n=1 Tax=Immundisolibacter sp. TaxID=1934948 RepID=UPI003EE13D91